jgi:hypothetical protein
MDSAQGAAPAGGNDWRSRLQPEARGRIVDKITKTLMKHLPISVPWGQNELQKIAVRFEEKIYAAATSQSDYLRKICLKTLSLEGQISTQQNPQNVQVVQNQSPQGLASEDSTAQSDYPGAGNWQEELYQMIKTMNNKYLPELSDLYNKVSMKLQHIENHMPSQKLTEQYEKMKNFKLMLELATQFLQMDKSCVQLALKDKLPAYERQIVNILNSQKRKPAQTSEQSAKQTPSRCSTCRIPVDSAAQTGYPGAGDLHELYEMNRTLKDQYVAGLSDLYKISRKLHADSNMAFQKPTDQDEEMKSFKSMLDRSLHPVEIGKGSIQPALEESIPMYKRQIASILNSEEWKPEQAFQQVGGQALSTGSGILSPERSSVKRLRPCLNDDTRS